MRHTGLKKLLLAAVFLAMCMLLPFLTANNWMLGETLLPMHLPVLLCGFICGWPYGLAAGLIAPLLRSVLIGMPPIFPTAIAMSCELAVYGLLAGLLYMLLPKKAGFVYVSLILAMLGGRLIWGGVTTLLYTVDATFEWGFHIFLTKAFVTGVVGIAIQIVLIPLIILALERAKLLNSSKTAGA